MVPAVTAQMWIPVTMAEHVEPVGSNRVNGRSTGNTRLERRGQHWLWLKGRMKPGVTIAQVRTELDGIVERLGTEFPETMAKERVVVVPTKDVRINPDIDATIAPAGLLMVAAVGLVLIVACANLANLMLARAAGRRREIARARRVRRGALAPRAAAADREPDPRPARRGAGRAAGGRAFGARHARPAAAPDRPRAGGESRLARADVHARRRRRPPASCSGSSPRCVHRAPISSPRSRTRARVGAGGGVASGCATYSSWCRWRSRWCW